jgi:hypothetical protein
VNLKSRLYTSAFLTLFLGCALPALAQGSNTALGSSQKAGKYLVTLRLPEGGLVAGEEQQIEFRIIDTSREDPVLGPAPVIRAVAKSTIIMPAMSSMPAVEETAHPEGVPGDYGLHPSFAHGGDFLLTLRISPPADQPFTLQFPLKVGDENPGQKPRPKPFQVQLKTEPGRVKAGEPATLKATVWSNREMPGPDGRPSDKRKLEQVRAFDLVHERRMHLIIVRKDLSFFTHQHPEIQPDGSFVLAGFVFPTAGDYQLFFDTAPKDAGGQVIISAIRVEGKAADVPKSSVVGERLGTQAVDGVQVALKDARALTPRKTLPFTITFRAADSGNPILDLQPYLGAMGHMIMIHDDAQTFVHAHPDERDLQNGKQGELTFLARPPKPGLYHLWVEFQRQNKVGTAEFVIDVRGSER